MQGFGIDDDAIARSNCEYSRVRAFSFAVGLEVRKKNVGFMVPVRVQAVTLLFTLLMHYH